MMMARIDATIPAELKEWLREEAAREARSLSQIIARLLETEKKKALYTKRRMEPSMLDRHDEKGHPDKEHQL